VILTHGNGRYGDYKKSVVRLEIEKCTHVVEMFGFGTCVYMVQGLGLTPPPPSPTVRVPPPLVVWGGVIPPPSPPVVWWVVLVGQCNSMMEPKLKR
jgi:hypothetical protein